MEFTNEEVEKLRKEYLPGTKVRCIHMDDPYHPVPYNMEGIVEKVDDGGTIHVIWDNGSYLGLIPNVDVFEKATMSSKKREKER